MCREKAVPLPLGPYHAISARHAVLYYQIVVADQASGAQETHRYMMDDSWQRRQLGSLLNTSCKIELIY